MIHKLSNKNQRSIEENDDVTVSQKENVESNETNSVDNGGGIGDKVDMKNDTSGNGFGGDYGVGAHNCNVSESVFDDIVIVDNVINDIVLMKKGDEVVAFDEDLVRVGCEKWKNTVYRYFIGCSMPLYDVKYNLRRMWGKHCLKEIIVDDEGLCFVKFRSEEGLNFVIDQSPWMVNGKLGYARVLVEIEANKGLHDSIEINYVFGHSSFICNVRPTTVEEIKKTKTKINTYNRKDGFEEVKNIRDKGKENRVPNTPAEKEIENEKDKVKRKRCH
ncbi:RNA-directed DNA polymerase, eukaryota, reverse transcriptase zinc-binding domain protein [Tanacetum coccineum]